MCVFNTGYYEEFSELFQERKMGIRRIDQRRQPEYGTGPIHGVFIPVCYETGSVLKTRI
jgi:hypothetical protein